MLIGAAVVLEAVLGVLGISKELKEQRQNGYLYGYVYYYK